MRSGEISNSEFGSWFAKGRVVRDSRWSEGEEIESFG